MQCGCNKVVDAIRQSPLLGTAWGLTSHASIVSTVVLLTNLPYLVRQIFRKICDNYAANFWKLSAIMRRILINYIYFIIRMWCDPRQKCQWVIRNDRLTETETENPVNRSFLANRNRNRIFVNRENRYRTETDVLEISKPKPKPENGLFFRFLFGYLPCFCPS